MTRVRHLVTAATAVTLLLSGCAQVHTGQAERNTGYDANSVNLALLDTGNYPTKPRAALGKADDPVKGAILEGHRLAENVTLPVQVDRTLSHVGWMGSGAMKSAKAVGVYMENDALGDAVQAHNYLTGFVVAANDATAPDFNQSLYLQNGVLEFPSDADAAAAAAAMASASDSQSNAIDKTPVPTVAGTVPGHPGTLARTWSKRYDTLNKTDYSMVAFTPHGRFVLAQSAISEKDPATTGTLVTGALAQQIPLIDAFTPTAPDQLVNLPRDPSGLDAHMLEPAEGNRTVENGSYGPHGALMFYTDPLATQQRYADYGVDLLIAQDGYLTRTKDAESARRFLDDEAGDQTSGGWTEIDGIPGLPSARCLRKAPKDSDDSPQYWCAVAVDRLFLEVDGKQATDVRQKLAAGYLMLTAK